MDISKGQLIGLVIVGKQALGGWLYRMSDRAGANDSDPIRLSRSGFQRQLCCVDSTGGYNSVVLIDLSHLSVSRPSCLDYVQIAEA